MPMRNEEIRTALIIERADVKLGGAERSVLELAAELEHQGVKVSILAAKSTASTKNIKVLCPSGPKRTSLPVFRHALTAHFIHNHYDVIHSTLPVEQADIYQPRGGSYKEAILQNAASYQNPFNRSLKRITHFVNARRYALLAAEKNLCQNDNSLVVAALSNYVKKQFQRHYNVPVERIAVIPNGISMHTSAESDKAAKLRIQVFDRLAINSADPPPVLLFAANNFRLKGLPYLLRAMKLAADKSPSARFCLIVAGSDSADPYRHMSRKLGIAERVEFIGSMKNIYNGLAIADAAVLPTWYDPCSRFILEALNAGKPVITTVCNGASERFKNGEHGITIDSPREVEALARAIEHYCDHENRAKASKAILRDGLAGEVSIGKHAEKMIELYKSIIGRKRT